MDKHSIYADDNLILCLSPYEQALIDVKIINVNRISDTISIHVPEVMHRNYVLYKIEQINPSTGEIDFVNHITQDSCHPWIDALQSLFDWNPGQHLYKFSFINRHTNGTCSAYLAYRAQTDSPEKPYDYMSKYRKNCEGED